MKAILVRQFGGPEVLKLEDLPDPRPGPTDVLVSVQAVGINPVETYVRTGTYAVRPDLPYIPGQDAAGVVEQTGRLVSHVKTGDRVYLTGTTRGKAQGGYASMATCHPSQVFRLPAGLSFAQGAAIGVPYGTAHRALFGRAGARPGESVLVHGASGGVGIAAVQLARAAGLRVAGTAGSDEGLDLVRAQGAHLALDHRKPDHLSGLRDFTGGAGVDLIIENLANVNLDKDLGVLAKFGRVVVVGNRGRIEIDPRQAMRQDSAILGMVLWNVPPGELEAIHADLIEGFESGQIVPVVGRELPLSDAPRAHELVLQPGAKGKVVLVP
jgi:NADPH2:quinone reductase